MLQCSDWSLMSLVFLDITFDFTSSISQTLALSTFKQIAVPVCVCTGFNMSVVNLYNEISRLLVVQEKNES